MYNSLHMVITYHGGTFVKVTFGDTTLAFNPISKRSKLKQSKFGSDIALVSQQHMDTNGTEQVAHSSREPFVISGPGEYEVKKVTITGFQSNTSYGGKEMINTIYIVKLEGMKLCFLGTLGEDKISEEAFEAMENIDILFMPVGGNGMLLPTKAHQLGVKISARIIIPIGYDDKTLKQFLKEEGGNGKPIDKLTVKRKDVEGKEGEVIVLSP